MGQMIHNAHGGGPAVNKYDIPLPHKGSGQCSDPLLAPGISSGTLMEGDQIRDRGRIFACNDAAVDFFYRAAGDKDL